MAVVAASFGPAGGFNPPFTPSFWRTNEVYIDVLENDVVRKFAGTGPQECGQAERKEAEAGRI